MQFQFEFVAMVYPNLIIPIGKLYNRPDQKVQILGLVFLILFTLVLVLQFISMLFHRWGTIAEILSSTRIISQHKKYRNAKLTVQEAVDLFKEMELEKDSQLDFSASNATGSTEDDATPEPDYLTQQDEDDILPEPEPDYFKHPAVNNVNNWNHRYKEVMTPHAPTRNSHCQGNDLNISYAFQRNILGRNRYNNNGGDILGYPPQTGNYPSRFGNPNNNHHNANGNAFSPRQAALKPLHGLDSRVMRQFRHLERHDPRFRNTRNQQNYFNSNDLGGYYV